MSEGVPIIGDERAAPAEQPSPEEVAALLNGLKAEANEGPSDLEVACAGALKVVVIPAVFQIKGRTDDQFLVDDFRAWGWTPFGILAIGRWESDAEDIERYKLFNGDEIANIELQFQAYEEAIEAHESSVEEESEEEEVSGDGAAESSSD